jgi:hypothetical protein
MGIVFVVLMPAGVDPCMVRFNAKCTENAHCDSANEEVVNFTNIPLRFTVLFKMPECICNSGFYGDGRRHCKSNGIPN